MNDVVTLSQLITDYGGAAAIACLIAVVTKLYNDLNNLHKEVREITAQTVEMNAHLLDTLNRNTEVIQELKEIVRENHHDKKPKRTTTRS